MEDNYKKLDLDILIFGYIKTIIKTRYNDNGTGL